MEWLGSGRMLLSAGEHVNNNQDNSSGQEECGKQGMRGVRFALRAESGGAGPLLVNRTADKLGNFRSDFFEVMRFTRMRGGLGECLVARGAAGDEPAVVKDFAAVENLPHRFASLPAGDGSHIPERDGANGLPFVATPAFVTPAFPYPMWKSEFPH